MKKIGLLLVPMALALSACQNGEKQAGQLFQRAEAAYAAGEYSLAKLQIVFVPCIPRHLKCARRVSN